MLLSNVSTTPAPACTTVKLFEGRVPLAAVTVTVVVFPILPLCPDALTVSVPSPSPDMGDTVHQLSFAIIKIFLIIYIN
ncbi:hypothetical protein M149_2458 [Bacteroides fragilis str. 1007-1-F |nr:hypothetical protein M149_2458 [Bacteroides fragilis str. 1007-1-F \